MPVLPLRGLSVFPGMLLNFDVERPMSVAALNYAMGSDQILFLTAQKDITKDMPFEDDLYRVGTVCRIRQLLRQPGNRSIRIMAEGLARGNLAEISMDKPCLFAEIDPMPDTPGKPSLRTEALCRRASSLFADYAETSGNIAPNVVINIMTSTDPAYVCDYVAQNIYLKPPKNSISLKSAARRTGFRIFAACSRASDAAGGRA
jgi:ATP-dependent Lon protease